MKTTFMLKYIFNILIVFFVLFAHAQNKKPDSLVPPKIERYGVRIGVDAVKLGNSFIENNYKGIELVGDYRVTKRYYLAAELGNENKTVQDTHLNFTTKGTFLKAGFDYNLYENWTGMHNIILVGMRYGASTFSQNLNSYTIYNANQYFGASQPVLIDQKFDGLNAQWLEVVLGLKAEVFSNIFVGFSVRVNRLITTTKPDNFDNLYIPGFNRTYEGNFGAGFNYTISYFIPFYKTTNSAKVKTKKP